MIKINGKITLTVLLLLFGMFSEQLHAQRWKLRRYEVGGGIGTTQVFGDIGGTPDKNNLYGLKDIKIDETRMAFAAYVRYKIDPIYSVKANLDFGLGHGVDTRNRLDAKRNYKTKLLEFSVQGEYYLISEEARYRSAAMFNRRGMLNNYSSISLYGFAGVGLVYSMANVYPKENISPTQDSYKPNSFGGVIPFGMGLKYIVDDRLLANAELGYRWSTSDYLDGITQIRGGSKHRDVYYFLTISLGYRLETTRRDIPAFMDRSYRQAHPTTRQQKRHQPKSKKQALH